MTGLEDKYLTTKNMWITELPKFISKPLFATIHFFEKVKYSLEYFRYIWKHDLCFDMDCLEFLSYMEFKLSRMKDRMDDVGNLQAKKQIKQALLYLEQYSNAESYVSCPEFLKEKSVLDFMDIQVNDDGVVSFVSKLSGDEKEEYTKYIQNLAEYEEESWDMFWKELSDNMMGWA